jgi:hypothetical protein
MQERESQSHLQLTTPYRQTTKWVAGRCQSYRNVICGLTAISEELVTDTGV